MVLKTFAKKYLSSYTLPKSALNTRFCHTHATKRRAVLLAVLFILEKQDENGSDGAKRRENDK